LFETLIAGHGDRFLVPPLYLFSPRKSGKELKYIEGAFDFNWTSPLGDNVDDLKQELANYNSIENAAVVTSELRLFILH